MFGIIVKTQFEGIHCYPEAPTCVDYLRNPHRHIFNIEVQVQTFHDDRELEFIKLKNELNQCIGVKYGCKDIGRTSCEQIAKDIQVWIKKRYPVPEIEKVSNSHTRRVNVTVYEDNENGAFVKEF